MQSMSLRSGETATDTAEPFRVLLALCIWLFLVAYRIRFHTHQHWETQSRLIDVARSSGKGREAQSSGVGLAWLLLISLAVPPCGDICCSQTALK